MTAEMLHATAVAIGGHGVLLLGPSGSGKSDLALRLIDRGAKLVSDDAVAVAIGNAGLVISAAPNIKGRIEVRGVGICAVESVPSAPLRLVAILTDDVERLPQADLATDVCGYDVPLVKIAAFETSAAIKLEYALRCVVDDDRWPVAEDMTRQTEGSHF